MTKETKIMRAPRNNADKAIAPALIHSTGSAAYGGADVDSLMAILQTKRPHGSKSEKKFSRVWLDGIPGMEKDDFGNRMIRIKGAGDSIMFASHVDTVHSTGGTQRIRLSRDRITLAKKSRSNCLGADDGAGVWLMLELIKAGKPGLYIFHRAEEAGGIGSNFIAQNTANVLKGIKACISLDRYGYDSVITDQMGKTASDKFAWSLGAALSMENLKPDETGLFTDSANYVEQIPECTNLSVGYFGHHTNRESLDLAFICHLRESLINMDSTKIEIERTPASLWDSYDDDLWDQESDDLMVQFSDAIDRDGLRDKQFISTSGQSYNGLYENRSDHAEPFERELLIRAIENHPGIVATLFDAYGLTIDEIYQAIGSADRL